MLEYSEHMRRKKQRNEGRKEERKRRNIVSTIFIRYPRSYNGYGNPS